MLDDLAEFLKSVPDGPIGVAVSGGGDSIALLDLVTRWGGSHNRRILAATVNHGLRDAARGEAEDVAQVCARLGVPHEILDWDGKNHRGNVQDGARRARVLLMSDWARRNGLAGIATGHTKDDQAETFLQRLKRGSGVDGLSAMAPMIEKDGVLWMRPLLTCRRQALRDYLAQQGLDWVEDPSNEDERFDRVKFRKALAGLEEIGLSVDVLSDTAARMARARGALEHAALDCARRVAEPLEIGSVRLCVSGMRDAQPETAFRVLAHSLRWVSGAEFRPRFKALELAMDAVLDGRAHSLSGCLITQVGEDHVEISREVSAMPSLEAGSGVLDGRWQCGADKGEWRALGEDGILLCPEWRQSGRTRKSVLASPSLWYNNELKSAPFVTKTQGYECSLIGGAESFYASLLTH